MVIEAKLHPSIRLMSTAPGLRLHKLSSSGKHQLHGLHGQAYASLGRNVNAVSDFPRGGGARSPKTGKMKPRCCPDPDLAEVATPIR